MAQQMSMDDWPNTDEISVGDLVIFGRTDTLWYVKELIDGRDRAVLTNPMAGGKARSEQAQTAYLAPFDPDEHLPINLPSGRDSHRSLHADDCPDCGGNRVIHSSHDYAGVWMDKCAVCGKAIDQG